MRKIVANIFNLLLACLLIFLPFFSLPVPTFAAFNKQINYQGKLTNASNVAVTDGSYNIRFKLYTAASGGSPIWTETWCYSPDSGATCNGTGTDARIPLLSGLFSTMLGSTTALTGIDFNQTLYLGVEIGGTSSGSPTWDGEMAPRKKIGTVPAAITAENLGGVNNTEFFRSDATNSTTSASTYLSVTQSGAGKVAEFFGPSSASILSVLSGGNVGIGTSTPDTPLTIYKDVVSGTSNIIRIGGSYGSVGNGRGIIFSDNFATDYARIRDNAESGGVVGLAFDTRSGGTLNEKVRISGPGFLGIGTTSPYAALSVVGPTGIVADKIFATSSVATSTFAGNITLGNATVYANNSSFSGGASVFSRTITANGSGSLAFGSTGVTGSHISSSGNGSIALGYGGLIASNNGAFAFGYGDSNNGGDITSSGFGSFAGGYSSTNSITASGNGSFAFGNALTATQSLSTAFGSGFNNTTANSFMVGYSSTPTFTVISTGANVVGTFMVNGATSSINNLAVVNGTTTNATTTTFVSTNATTTSLAVTGTATSTFSGGVRATCFTVDGTTCLTSSTASANSKWATSTGSDITPNGGGGIMVFASSTITSLTVANGTTTNATSTNLYISGRVSVGSTSPVATFSVNPTAGQASAQFVVGSSTRTSLYVGNDGNVGINTPAPLSKLAVNGGVAIGAYATTTAAPSNGLIVSGNVGIGTSSPVAPLHVVSSVAAVASGGTITHSGLYTIHTFTSSGTFTVLDASVTSVEVLVVAGGGGGGSHGGGGGGAGGLTSNASYSTSPGAITVTVGAGGAGGATGTNAGSSGGNSVFGTITTTGGGGGGSFNQNGAAGGSGGGAGKDGGTGGAGTAGQGNNGGTTPTAGSQGGSGGGGAGAVGANGGNNGAEVGGNGGAGTASSISGTSVTYAGGGGGAVNWGGVSSSSGTGGAGGGGAAGATVSAVGSNGTANSGGGGGAGDYTSNAAGGTGGSGIVIVRYITAASSEQVRVGYDLTNYMTTLVGSSGGVTLTSAGATPLFNFTGGNVGIASSTPFSTLSVTAASGSATTSLFGVASSTNTTLFNVLGNGNVGIGTTTPGALFAVHGAGYISSNLFVGGTITSTTTAASTFPSASTTALSVNGALMVNAPTSTITNLVTIKASSTEATSTSLFATTFKATNATTTSLAVTGLGFFPGGFISNTSSSTVTNLVTVNATSTSATSSVFFTTSFKTTNATSTTLSVTGLSLFSGGILVNNATSTINNLAVVNGTTTNATTTTFVATNATTTSLGVIGTATSTFTGAVRSTCFSTDGTTCLSSSGGGSGTVNSGTFGQVAFYGANGTAVSGTSTLVIGTTTNDANNIGIGTSTPYAKLSVVSSAGVIPFVVASSTGTILDTINRFGDFSIGGYTPSLHNAPNNSYRALWMDSSNSGFVGETTSGFKGVDMIANVVRNDNVWSQQDSSRNSFLASLGYEASNNGFSIYSAPAGSGNSFTKQFSIDSTTGYFAGTVGIGAAATAGQLHLTSATTYGGGTAQLLIENSSTGQTIFGLKNTSSSRSWEFGVTGSGNIGSGAFYNYDVTAGAVRFLITTAGKVGIGTGVSLPLSQLDIGGGVAIGSYAATNAAPTNGLIVSGNVGVATTSPWAVLAVNPTAGAASNQFVVGSSTATNFVIDNAGKVGVGTTSPWAAFSVNPTAGKAGAQFAVGSSSKTNFVITNSGFVGVGLPAPAFNFQVAGATGAPSSSSGSFAVGTPNVGTNRGITMGFYDSGAYNYIQGWGSSPLAINPQGNNVCIGCTNPGSYALQVQGATSLAYFNGNSPGSNTNIAIGDNSSFMTVGMNDGAGGAAYLFSFGQVNIDANANGSVYNFSTDLGAPGGINAGSTIRTNGDLSAAGDVCSDNYGCLSSFSDMRLKKNIASTTNLLEKLSKIDTITYNYNDIYRDIRLSGAATGTREAVIDVLQTGEESATTSVNLLANQIKKEYMGVSAQSVQAVLPDLVNIDANGYLTVDYQHLTAVAVGAINELNAKVSAMTLSTSTGGTSTTSVTTIIQSYLSALGTYFKDGIAYIASLVTNSLTVGTAQKPTGITLYDEVTSAPYCVTVAAGVMKTSAGSCDQSSSQAASVQGAQNGTPTPGNESSGTSTPSVIPPAQATSSDPNINTNTPTPLVDPAPSVTPPAPETPSPEAPPAAPPVNADGGGNGI